MKGDFRLGAHNFFLLPKSWRDRPSPQPEVVVVCWMTGVRGYYRMGREKNCPLE